MAESNVLENVDMKNIDTQVAHWNNTTFHMFFNSICMFYGIGLCKRMRSMNVTQMLPIV